jgi:hypothetical protein
MLINKYDITTNCQADSVIFSNSLIDTDGSDEHLLLKSNLYSIIIETDFIELPNKEEKERHDRTLYD